MTLNYTFVPEDERRLLTIFGRITMRMPFLIMLAAVTPIFLFMGVAVASEEVLPGILIILIGLGVIFRVVTQIRYRSLIKRNFRESLRSRSCTWVFDDEGISSVSGEEKMRWASFKRAAFCPEGLVLTGGAFAWIPKEALSQSADVQTLRQFILKHRIRYEERA